MSDNGMPGIERTLVVLKPDTVQRGIVGEIITRFERAGLKIVGMKMDYPDEAHYWSHYEDIGQMITRHGEEIYELTLEQLMDSPVIAMVLEGVEAVSFVRKLAGTTNPKEAPAGTIRGDYTHVTKEYVVPRGATLPNILHTSSNLEEAEKEVALWFAGNEIFSDYDIAQGPIVRGKLSKKKQ